MDFEGELVLALPVAQVADALGVSQRTVRRWIKAREAEGDTSGWVQRAVIGAGLVVERAP